jgi:hypothetical protein
MPEGRQRFSTGNGPPGSSPGGPTPETLYDIGQSIRCLKMVNNLYEKQRNASTGTTFIENTVTQSAMISIFESYRTMCRNGMHEHPDIVSNLKQSRTRLPANKEHQTRGLRHGCQGSVTTNNPIMEE